ncbi:hypothetical protein CXF83_08490 [Shewanella sp. Choline-02u-19]|uniref:hypothetical protein n=1 Tax=unclassified Shewanella TaxID=196818 RepID=UPI000C3332D3|nr:MULTISPECIES: hypothetical protein [unclassified Shewanella]PKH62110.1 hypothetical protein CXF84_01440 [Shewanella sp. Bg11-22]PKI26771.1 hypothetical protein CXF83_08490 [Shewanella sp. Choline-02u-19]
MIGAAELIYAEASSDVQRLAPKTMSNFITKEHKLLFLFAHDESEKNIFTEKSESLRKAAESTNTKNYRDELNSFSKVINDRVLKEWNVIK